MTSTTQSSSSPSSSSNSSYSFVVEWFDTAASLSRKYTLTYFPSDSSLELFDLKNRRTFLKRTPYASVSLASLYLGATLTVYARTLRVISYGDESTRSRLEADQGRTLAIVKPAAVGRIGQLLRAVHDAGLRVGRLKMLRMTPELARQWYGDNAVTGRAAELASGPIIAVEAIGKGAQQQVGAMLAAISAPGSSSSPSSSVPPVTGVSDRSAQDELNFLFNNPSLPSPATLADPCSLLIIKPHAVAAGVTGAILSSLPPSLCISALSSFHLNRETADEFLAVYKGVVAEHSSWVEELSSGQCVAAEVVSRRGGAGGAAAAAEEEKEGVDVQSRSVVQQLRDWAGPYDPEVAKQLRAGSVRAVYGATRVKNAVHVTDLPEDGPLESEFFFSLLENAK